jgi:arylsulfatase
MIDPGRVSDGLFDISDLLPTFLTLAGLNPLTVVSPTTYIDGIDQTSYLLGPAALSNRKFVYYWQQAVMSSIRCAEYKWSITGTSTDQSDVVNPGGFSGVQETYSYAKMFNLYLDPKETHSFLIRKLVYSETFSAACKAHLKTFRKYLPKVLPIFPLTSGVPLENLPFAGLLGKNT